MRPVRACLPAPQRLGEAREEDLHRDGVLLPGLLEAVADLEKNIYEGLGQKELDQLHSIISHTKLRYSSFKPFT